MKRHLVATVVAGALAFAVGEAQAATITIDSFDDGLQSVSATSGTVFDSVTGSTSEIVGGERDVQLEIIDNQFGRLLNAEVDALPPPPEPGILTISNDTGVESKTIITWDGVGGSGLNLDVTGGGMNKFFRFDILTVDLSAVLTLSVNNTATLTKTVSETTDPTSVIFKFSEFDNASAMTFTDVQSISLMISGPANFDLTADSLVATVPEPLTILGSGLALGFGGLLKKEYDKKQKKS